jgi:hypothetical protein
MGINISRKIINEIIDDNERNNIEDLLIQKAAGKCFLCSSELDSQSQEIEADHDIPVAQGGDTTLENLNLAHTECNRFKRANPTIHVKKFLPLKKFIEINNDANFEIVSITFFKITPKAITVRESGLKKISITCGTTTFVDIPIYEEVVPNRNKTIEYCFIQVPVYMVFNDDVQPRPIKPNHVFNLFQDLHINPLHEPASARLEKMEYNQPNKLLMFDGQHKAVAKLLIESEHPNYNNVKIDLKLYLNLTRQEATHLVNSIQSKIIKLGLTKSEFARKMGSEFENDFNKYEHKCLSNNIAPTEIGFINDAPAELRKRRKEALIQTRLKQLIYPNDPLESTLKIFSLTQSSDPNLTIKETTLFTKVLQKLLCITPLSSEIDIDDKVRSTERINIRLVLDAMFDVLFTESPILSKTLINQFKSQSSLVLIVEYTKLFLANQLFVDKNRVFFHNDLSSKIEVYKAFLNKFKNHPVWSYCNNPNKPIKAERFFNLVKQNQSLTEMAETIKLTVAYCAGYDQLRGTELD